MRIVDDKTRFGTVWLFDIFPLEIVDLHFLLCPCLGIIGREPGGFFKSAVGKFSSFCLDDNMGTGSFFGVKPPVVAGSQFKCQFVVLEIVFAYIDVETVGADIVEGTARDLCLFRSALSADIAAFDQFFLDLDKVFFLHGDVQGGGNGFQMFDLLFDFYGQFGKRFKCPL